MALVNARCRRCGARRTLSMLPERYFRVPLCRRCPGVAEPLRRWRVDRYRMTVERKRPPCLCAHGYTFPHRRGSRWCVHVPDHLRPSEADQQGRFSPSMRTYGAVSDDVLSTARHPGSLWFKP